MHKRVTAIILTLALLLSVISVPAFATAGTDGSVSATATKTKVKADEEFTINIALNKTSDTPAGAIDFTVNLPSGLEYVSH